MKKAISEKLNSRSGVSIIIALVLFLVAAMVSAVLISAAYTAFKSVRTEIRDQQDYLCVSSSARLIGQGIKDTKCYVTTRKVETSTGETVEEEKTTYVCEGFLGPYIAEAMDQQFNQMEETSHSMTISLEGLPDDASAALGTCTFDFEITLLDWQEPEKMRYVITGFVTAEGYDQKIRIIAAPSYTKPQPSPGTATLENGDIEITTVFEQDWANVTLSATGGV